MAQICLLSLHHYLLYKTMSQVGLDSFILFLKFKFIDLKKTKFKFIDFEKTKFKFMDFEKSKFKFQRWAQITLQQKHNDLFNQ